MFLRSKPIDCAWLEVRCGFSMVSRLFIVRGYCFFFTFGELPATIRLRDSYFNIYTVCIATGDLAGKIHTGSVKHANNNIFSFSQIIVAFGDGGTTNKWTLLPLKSRSSADLLRFPRK